MPKIEIYTQFFCPYCARAISVLKKQGVEYTEIDAPNGSDARNESIKRAGGKTSVPQIFINGTHIGGSDELVQLVLDGKLDAMLAA